MRAIVQGLDQDGGGELGVKELLDASARRCTRTRAHHAAARGAAAADPRARDRPPAAAARDRPPAAADADAGPVDFGKEARRADAERRFSIKQQNARPAAAARHEGARAALAKLDAMLKHKGLTAATLFKDKSFNASLGAPPARHDVGRQHLRDSADDLLDAREFAAIRARVPRAADARDREGDRPGRQRPDRHPRAARRAARDSSRRPRAARPRRPPRPRARARPTPPASEHPRGFDGPEPSAARVASGSEKRASASSRACRATRTTAAARVHGFPAARRRRAPAAGEW